MQFSQENPEPLLSHKGSSASCPLLELQWDYRVSVPELFEAFKSKDAVQEWWWPKGLHADRVDYDFREGGRYYFSMDGASPGPGMTGRFVEIAENERIVITDHFADEKGHPISAKDAKMPGAWPAIGYITFEFEAKGPGGSRLRLSQEGIPSEIQKDCKQGWREMFEKLERFVAKRRH